MRLRRFGVFLVALGVALRPGLGIAQGLLQGISGIVEFSYSNYSSELTDANGNVTETDYNTYITRATLQVNTDIFPKLNLNAGAVAEKTVTDPRGNDAARKTEITRLKPYIWLTLNDPLYTASAGYALREEKFKVSGVSSLTLVQENYNAYLNWYPEGLPSTRAYYTHTKTYDRDRSSQDEKTDYFFLKEEYIYQGLDVYYYGTYNQRTNDILNLQSTEWANEGRLRYSDMFFEGRTSFYTDLQLVRRQVETQAEGVGYVGFQLFPFAGLAAIDDTPADSALSQNPALIDGNLTASAGINLGLPGVGGTLGLRNIGLDFQTQTELNRLLLWVDRELPQDIASSFSWDLYISSDNLNWTFLQTISPAIFGPFQNSFEINFPTITTRYIKVVTRPLSPTVPDSSSFPDIFVTELQAFVNRPAGDVEGKTTSTFQNYYVDAKTRVLDLPTLYYDFNAYYRETDPFGERKYNIINTLLFNHTFNPIFSADGNLSLEYGTEGNETRTAYVYFASLRAQPLRTLSHTLVFNGNNQDIGGRWENTNGVQLYNNAKLYQGVDVNLNLGLIFTSNESEGGSSLNRREGIVNFGTTIIPHPTLNLTAYYVGRISDISGGESTPSGTLKEQRFDFGLSYQPFRALYLSYYANLVTLSDQDTTVRQNFTVNFSPFPDGVLQFVFYYNESYEPDRTRIIQPSVRLFLTKSRSSYVECLYQITDSDLGNEKLESNLFNTNLKIIF
jgi:hypothetical protein